MFWMSVQEFAAWTAEIRSRPPYTRDKAVEITDAVVARLVVGAGVADSSVQDAIKAWPNGEPGLDEATKKARFREIVEVIDRILGLLDGRDDLQAWAYARKGWALNCSGAHAETVAADKRALELLDPLYRDADGAGGRLPGPGAEEAGG